MTPNCVIRRLEAADAELWAAVRWEALTSHPLTFGASPPDDLQMLAESVRARLTAREESAILGAFDGTALIGIVGVVRESSRKERHKAVVWGMYVQSSHRRCGIGKLLLNAAIEQATFWQGVRQVLLSVTEVADDARKLYEQRGFRVWGREPRALYSEGRYADEIFMILDLSEWAGGAPEPGSSPMP